ncbi:hypothetical protein H6768_05380 [Candidatus Peribacteria bacterium]|nr:hypothetical protein [Candidatus Peribacteria bacterium]
MGIIYQHRDTVVTNVRSSVHHFFPCKLPLTYSLGNFDTQFGILREDFLANIARAETAWEQEVGKELFHYVETGGDITVNLIYDERQETTVKLREIDTAITGKQGTYETLKAEYEALNARILEQKTAYERSLAQIESFEKAYSRDVESWNKRGGAPEKEYARLEDQRRSINARIAALNTTRANLNTTITQANQLAARINQVIEELHLDVEKFNTTRATHGEEFSEGEYVRDETGRHIDIYEFGSELKLTRVLTHELGHAL